MIEYSNTLGGGGSSTATLPDQISNLACTGGTDGTAGTIDVSFTEVPATSFDLLKYYILIYKAGGIPQTPFDGTRITLDKGTADAKLEHQITGLTFDQLYGVRIYPVSKKNQYQTLAEGSTATATPVSTVLVSTLELGALINSERGNYRLVHKSSSRLIVFAEYAEDNGTLHRESYIDKWDTCAARNYLINNVIPNLGTGWKKWLIDSTWQWAYGWSDYEQYTYIGKGCFPSMDNLNRRSFSHQYLPKGDIVWDYFRGEEGYLLTVKLRFLYAYSTSTLQTHAKNIFCTAITSEGYLKTNYGDPVVLRYALSLSPRSECNPFPNKDGSYTLM